MPPVVPAVAAGAASAPVPVADASPVPITWSALHQKPPVMYRMVDGVIEEAKLVAGPEGSRAQRGTRLQRGGLSGPPA